VKGTNYKAPKINKNKHSDVGTSHHSQMWELPTIVRNSPFACPICTTSPRPFACWMCLRLSTETDTNRSNWETSDWILSIFLVERLTDPYQKFLIPQGTFQVLGSNRQITSTGSGNCWHELCERLWGEILCRGTYL